MAASAELDLQCPKCRATIRHTPAGVLRPGSAELRALLRGQLNRVRCGGCGFEYLHPAPLLYRDDERCCLIYHLPRQLGAPEEALKRLLALATELFAELPEDARPACRLATSRNQFLEKIVLLHQGLDDRLVEYVKYQLFQHSPGLSSDAHDVLYDFEASNDTELRFVVYERANGQPRFALSFQRATYNELREYFLDTPEMVGELDRLYPPGQVSVEALLAQ